MKRILALFIFAGIFYGYSATAQQYKVEGMIGKKWVCYASNDKVSPVNNHFLFAMQLNNDHTYNVKTNDHTGVGKLYMTGEWRTGTSDNNISLTGDMGTEYAIEFYNNDFLKLKKVTGEELFFIAEQRRK